MLFDSLLLHQIFFVFTDNRIKQLDVREMLVSCIHIFNSKFLELSYKQGHKLLLETKLDNIYNE